jgi:hypothetical protein
MSKRLKYMVLDVMVDDWSGPKPAPLLRLILKNKTVGNLPKVAVLVELPGGAVVVGH